MKKSICMRRFHVEKEYPMCGAYPSQEGTSSQGGPPAWFLEYFGKLNESMGEIKHRDFYEKQGETINRLGNLYETMHEQHSHQMADVEAQLEGLWVHLVPPPPPPLYESRNAPPYPLYRAPLY
ncbi:hypothetical protein Acr_08g0014720 [Actinidia rufa]|uniref:Uncharacterized protein n=1 Tax=Actinidia rufa TaxID=165716 RepID=A0A7J0F3T5_9ERIC|nr:hypothetical protein Acr_08g0014720 [Actinidia rufa]